MKLSGRTEWDYRIQKVYLDCLEKKGISQGRILGKRTSS